MTDSQLAQQTLEVAVYNTLSDSQLAQQTAETTVYNTLSDTQLAQQTLEVSVVTSGGDSQLAQQSLEVAAYAIGSDAVLAFQAIEVATYGNGVTPTPGTGVPTPKTYGPGPYPCKPLPAAGTLSSTMVGYVPRPGFYVTPVQIGSVNNLTVCRTPAGRAILAWNDGNVFYTCVLDDPKDVFRNNVVAESRRWTAFSVPIGLLRGSIWLEGCDLFFAVAYLDSDLAGRSECYIANDSENPTSWTLRGTMDFEAYNGGGIVDSSSVGPVTVTSTGRWILPFTAWVAYAGAAPSDASGLFTSDNRGVTWTTHVEHRQPPILSGTTGPIANTISQDPVTGYLYWSHYWGPGVSQGRTYQSVNGGATWDLDNNGTLVAWNFYTDNGTSRYYAARRNHAGGHNAWEVIDSTVNSGYVDTGIQIINSDREANQFQFIMLGNIGAAIIDKDRIVAAPLVRPPPLFIPYKDRLHHHEP